MSLRSAYERRFSSALPQVALSIESQLREYLLQTPHVDRVTARAKSVDRFLSKANKTHNNLPKYSDPITQIQDQIGARIITFYLSDVEVVSEVIKKYYRPIEIRNLVPESEWEFGYFGVHYVLFMPSDVVDHDIDRNLVPEFFELQIKTLFQHAWSEAEHDLGYKPGASPLAPDEKRQLAFTAAQAWGADRMFDELYKQRSR